MDTTKLKDCTNCKHLAGKQSIDDVASECFPCVHHRNTLGYYPNWEPVEVEVTPEEDEEWVRKEMGWQGYTKIIYQDNMKPDNVNSPSHYTQGGIETIDYITAKLGVDGTIAYCMGNVMKYTSRWQDKGGLEDLNKALWYLNYAIEMITLKDNDAL